MDSEELKKLLGVDEYYQGVIRGIIDVFKKMMIIIGIFSLAKRAPFL